MRAHEASAAVQQQGCGALANICSGTDAAASGRKQAARDAGTAVALATAADNHPTLMPRIARMRGHLQLP
eukprot:3630771-Prymnesium_polylepis.1